MGKGVILVVLLACGHLTIASYGKQAKAVDSYDEFASAMNKFAGHMYQIVTAVPGNNNVVFSPLSITQAMGMLLAGAKGNTRDEIRKALKVSHDYQIIHKYLRSIRENATVGTTSCTPNIANGMFIQNGLTVFENYSALLQNEYSAAFQNVNFGNAQQAVDTINNWVSQHTANMNQNLLNPRVVDSRTRLVLMNVAFLDAQWKNKFEPCPFPMRFRTARGNRRISCMKLHTYLPWYADQTMHFTAVPYDSNQNQNTYMVIAIPNSYYGNKIEMQNFASRAQDVLVNLDPTKWHTQEVVLSMPKFNVSCNAKVKKVLMKMGVVDLFSEANSDLSGISGEPLHVSNFLHRARIEVSEKGTRATAASAIGRTTRYKIFRVDRPFFFGIYNVPTKMYTFIGKVENPSV